MKYFPIKGFGAMSWCGKIILKKGMKLNTFVENHERIHLEQALQYKSYIAYYWQYFKYWLSGNPFFPPFKSAYYTNPFEMEAYANEHNFNYKVTKNSWLNYNINNKKSTYKENRLYWKYFCVQKNKGK